MTTNPDDLNPQDFDIDLDREISDAIEETIATPETRDRRVAQDHSNLLMSAMPVPASRQSIAAQKRLLGPYEMLRCPRCHSERFAVAVSATDNFLAIVCGNLECGAMWPALEVTPIQINDRVARDTGLWIPDRSPKNPRLN